jgi:hypothetical protein
MEIGRSALPGRRWVAFALAALLALTLVVTAGSAGAAGAGHAVAAKKKCKKKRSFQSAKKRKCKKKKAPQQAPQPTPVQIPGPLVRATISWPAGEVDLHAFDASGNRSGIAFPCSSNPCPITEGIPNATHSVDSNNGGSETFTDLIFVQGGTANREFAYGVCWYTTATVNVTLVNRAGQSQTIPITDTPGGGHTLSTPTGPQVPSSFTCPA